MFVFPNAIPWLIAAWFAGYTSLVFFGRHGLLCLALCLAVLLGKRLTPAPSLLGLMAVMLAIIFFRALANAQKRADYVTMVCLAQHSRVVDCLGWNER